MTTCQVLEELDFGMCKEAATIRVHDPEDTGAASILCCADHVPLGRFYVRRQTKSRYSAQSVWIDTNQGASA